MIRIIDPQNLLPMRTSAADRKGRYSLDAMVEQTEALYYRLLL